ncbi:MAG: glycosyltransferase [Deltaproteobacteria bacterium]|nr:glycosyltransferase [Deltaproteobacteria bacterium]TLN03597.1 MAG: glycosyltransferase [bacterium]
MDKRLNILHLRASNFVGGPEKQLLEHIRRIDRKKYRLSLCTFEGGNEVSQLRSIAEASGIETHELSDTSPFDPRVIFKLSGIVKKLNIHLLCTHGYKPNIIGRFASWLSGVPVIAISRGWTAENRKIRFYERLDKIFLHLSDHVVAVSGGQREKIKKLGVGSGKISVIHNGINLAEIPQAPSAMLRASFNLPEDAVIIASAGRLSPEKNQSGMIEVARQVVSCNNKAYFVIFGEGFLREELERQIEAAGLQGRFLLPGFRGDLQSLLHEVDIFMLPSFTEGLPNVVLEAFAVRKPVVASAVGGTPEVVTHGVSGFLAGPGELGKMAEYVHQLVNDPALRDCMGERGYRHIEEEFGFEQQTQKYEELYSIVSKSRREAVTE